MKYINHSTIGHGVDVKKSTLPHAGRGLFSTKMFLKNSLITELQGKSIYAKSNIRKKTHVRTVSFGYHYIDGDIPPQDGNGGAAFANDACDSQKNNTIFYRVWDAKEARYRIFLKAKKDIFVGEEIFVSYGKTYWKQYY